MNTFESKTEMVQKYKKNASFKCPFCDLTIFGVTKYNLNRKKHNLTGKLYPHFTKEHSRQNKFQCPKCPRFFQNFSLS